MQIFVTGGTGFVGRVVVKLLVANGHRVVALVRPGSEAKLPESALIQIHHGNVENHDCLTAGMRDCQAIIHLVGIIREFPERGVTFSALHVETTRNLILAAETLKVRRFLHMSSNGADPQGKTAYGRSKWQAEELVRNSQLDWTIFRPSVIFGPQSDFLKTLAQQIQKFRILPVIGDGRYRLQPVAIEQVAETFVKALSRTDTVRQVYHLAGAESYSFNEIIDLVGRAMGKRIVLKVHQPIAIVRPTVRLLQNNENFPMTEEQMELLLAGDVSDPQLWAETFDIKPSAFANEVSSCFAGAKGQRHVRRR